MSAADPLADTATRTHARVLQTRQDLADAVAARDTAVRALRTAGWTQAQIAALLGITQQAVQKITRDR